MVDLRKGENTPLAGGPVEVAVSWPEATTEARRVTLDICALRLGRDGKVREDADFVFFNAPATPDGAVRHGGPLPGGAGETIMVDVTAQPADVHTVVVTATIDVATPGLTFGGLPVRAAVRDARTGAELVAFTPPALPGERALVVVEIYRRGDGWKVRAVGQGYAAGLAGLAADYGVEVDAAPEPTPHAPSAAPGPQPSALAGGMPVDMRKQLDLRKHTVGAILVKSGLGGQRARVGLVLDASGSMFRLYRAGTVARVVERIAAVAARLDDDGSLDVWSYATNPLPLPAMAVEAMATWIPLYVRTKSTATGVGGAKETKSREKAARDAGWPVPQWTALGGQNDEPKVMNLVVDHYTRSQASGTRAQPPPALVVFLTDGGIYKNAQIADILREASALPVFWQFVGVGRSTYGVLEKLDRLAGRVVDNAGFFAVDDLDLIGDGELYARLLGEFPSWLRAARAAGIPA